MVIHSLGRASIPTLIMAKTIFTGTEDSGKSYMLAYRAGQIAERNHDWLKITGIPRPIRSNLEFQPWFYDWVTKDLGIPIYYWKDIEEWPSFRSCDMIVDELGAYLDSRTYANLPLDIRLWLSQASKLGVDMFASAQDFAQVDISFRRLVKSDEGGLFQITKIIGSGRPNETKPPVKRIWGICAMRELDPTGYNEDDKKFASDSFLPYFFFLRKEVCSIFDTTKRIAKSKPPPYKHIARRCEIPNCGMQMFENIDGHKHKISHV